MLFALSRRGVGCDQSSTRCKTYGAIIKVGGFIIIHIRIYIIMEFHLFLVSIITAGSEVVRRIPDRGASTSRFGVTGRRQRGFVEKSEIPQNL